MLIDGEKWACDACIRGHRVSTCHHSDRELKHINKKGRPVTQCNHCRGLRKARSAHVKCDCGEKSHAKGQCAHVLKGDSKAGLHTCCCSHGERCSCALKKEQDPLADAEPPNPPPKASIAKPRLTTAQSDGSLVVANGHHKPAHKHNDMAHRCGVPYKIPRPHTIHGSAMNAQRSVDSLPTLNTFDASSNPSPTDGAVFANNESRLVKSEHNSPILTSAGVFDFFSERPPPLDLSTGFATTDMPTHFQPTTNLNGSNYFDAPSNFEQPIFSAGIDPPDVDWSTFNFPLDAENNPFSAAYAQPPSYASLDYTSNDYTSNLSNGHPALTTSSSGEVSEVEDFNTFADANPMNPPPLINPNVYSSESSETADTSAYHLSNPVSTFTGMQQPAIEGPLDIDQFLKEAAAGTTTFDNYDADGSLLAPAFDFSDPKALQSFVSTTLPAENNMEMSMIKSEPRNESAWPTAPSNDHVSYAPDDGTDITNNVWLS